MPNYVALGPEISPGVWDINSVHALTHTPTTLPSNYKLISHKLNDASKILYEYCFAEPGQLRTRTIYTKRIRKARISSGLSKIVWASNYVGYGNSFKWFSYAAIRTMANLGIPVKSYSWTPGSVDPDLPFARATDDDIKNALTITITRWSPHPGVIKLLEREAGALLGYLQVEGTLVKRGFINWLNRFDAILATSTASKQAILDSGINVPVHVFGHGIDPVQFPYVDRPADRQPFTFFHFADVQRRKGTDLVIKAFKALSYKDIRLYIKCQGPSISLVKLADSNQYVIETKGDNRIVWDDNNYSPNELAGLLGRMDCGLFPSRAEGFGMPKLECEATGMPCIATAFGGYLDHSIPDGTLLLNVEEWQPSDFDKGNQAEPDVDHLIHLMKHCMENRDEAKRRGNLASKNAHTKWKWVDKVRELMDVLVCYGWKS